MLPLREKLPGNEGERYGESGSFCRGSWDFAGGRNNLGARPNAFGRAPKYLWSGWQIPILLEMCRMDRWCGYVAKVRRKYGNAKGNARFFSLRS